MFLGFHCGYYIHCLGGGASIASFLGFVKEIYNEILGYGGILGAFVTRMKPSRPCQEYFQIAQWHVGGGRQGCCR